ncbi:MAG: hypothetical protein U0744_01865 [Gemmataceae bacterium]
MFQQVVALGVMLLSCAAMHAQYQQTDAISHLKPRLFTPSLSEQKLTEVLSDLAKQTGSKLRDRRSKGDDPVITMPAQGRTFWQMAQHLSETLNCRLSIFDNEGPALIDGVSRKQQPVSLDGIVRITLKRWNVQRDEENGIHVATATLDIAWEPRFEPFYLEVRPSRASSGKGTYEISGQGKESIANRHAAEVALRMPAPPRSVRQIDLLEGELRILGPSRMLEFEFADASVARSITQEGVTVAMKPGVRNPWAFDIAIRNPPGGPEFESFQTWLDHNRIQLERMQGGKTETWRPDPNAEELVGMLTAEQASIRYVFEEAQGKGLPKQWSLRYRTPGRIVELPVRFRFADLELP